MFNACSCTQHGTQHDLLNVTRLEVIDHRGGATAMGRVYSVHPCRVTLSHQDQGRTLKVFVDDPQCEGDCVIRTKECKPDCLGVARLVFRSRPGESRHKFTGKQGDGNG